MAEVGVLNLTIHDNSDQAAKGLNDLTGALRRVKAAVAGGLKLDKIAQDLEKLCNIVEQNINSSTISKLNELCSALEKLKGIGTVNIKVNYAKGSITAETDAIKNAMEDINSTAKIIDDDFSNIERRVSEAAEGMRYLAGSVEETRANLEGASTGAENFADALLRIFALWNQARMAMSLEDGGGGTGGIFGNLAEGAIYVEGTVTDCADSLRLYGETAENAADASNRLGDSTNNVANGMNKAANGARAFKSGLDGIENAKPWDIEEFLRGYDKIYYYEQRLEKLKNTLNKGVISGLFGTDTIHKYVLWIEELQNKIERLKQTVKGGEPQEVVDINQFIQAYDQASYLERKIQNLKDILQSGIESGLFDEDKIKHYVDWINKLQEKLDKINAEKQKEAAAPINVVLDVDDYLKNFDKVEYYRNKIAELKWELAQGVAKATWSPDQIFGQIEKIESYQRKLDALTNTMESAKNITPINIEDYLRNYDRVEYLKNRIEELKQELKTGIETGKFNNEEIDNYITRINRLQEEYNRLIEAQEEAKASSFSLSGAFFSLKTGITAMFPTITGLIKRFASMAKMRMIRYIIRQVTAGIREGVENVYHYSKAIGSGFAPAMDQAATALQQMKNSIGAMLAPAIQALIPVLQSVVNWFINLLNYVNQFFALINGQNTWTRALPEQAEAFEKTSKAAKGASKATKDLLADWDELNIIQSQNSGGGGSGTGKTAEEYKAMFEEVSRFDSKIQTIVKGIEDTFGSIWNLVGEIGAGILLWKVTKGFKGILGTLAGLWGTYLTLDLVFQVTSMFDQNFLDTGEYGWLIASFITPLVGGTIAHAILSRILDGALAEIAIPLAFAVSAAATIVTLIEDTDVSALSEEGMLEAVNAGLKGGVAAGSALYTIGGFIAPRAIGAGAGAALFTFGATIGVKAVADVIESGELTSDDIIADLIAAGSIGAGLSITNAALLGNTVGAGMIIGTGVMGAIATFGALLLVEAIIDTLPDRMKWGDQNLTEEEIQAFVDNHIFNPKLKVDMDLAANAVTMTEQAKHEFSEKLKEAIGLIDVLTIGLDEDVSVEQIDEAVNGTGGVVEKFKDLQKQRKTDISIALAAVHVVGENGEPLDDSIVKTFATGFNTMDSVMTNLGHQLADALKDAYNESIEPNAREMAKKTVLEITQAMMDIEAINTANQSAVSMRNKFKQGLESTSQQGIQGMLNYYQQEKGETQKFIESQYQALLDEAEVKQLNFEYLAEKAKESGGKFAGYTEEYYRDMAKHFEGMYAELEKYRDESIKRALEFYQEGGEGLEMIRRYMLDLLKNNPITFENFAKFVLNDGVKEIFAGGENFGESALKGSKAEQNVKDLIMQYIKASLNPGDKKTVEDAINAGVLNYNDFVNKTMMDTLADTLGLTGELRGIWDQIVEKLLGTNTTNDSSYQTVKQAAAKKTEEAVEAVKDGIEVSKADASNANISDSLFSIFGINIDAIEKLDESVKKFADEATKYKEAAQEIIDAKEKLDEATEGALHTPTDLAPFEPQDTTVTPVLDAQQYNTELDNMMENTYKAVNYCVSQIESLMAFNGNGVIRIDWNWQSALDAGNGHRGMPGGLGGGGVRPHYIREYATGGFVRSGDLVMANENGNFEMMGRMGNQPVVANNQQIVSGISQGVATANSGLENRLTTIEGLLQRMLNKEFVARAVPDSRWGSHNARSQEAYDKVTG